MRVTNRQWQRTWRGLWNLWCRNTRSVIHLCPHYFLLFHFWCSHAVEWSLLARICSKLPLPPLESQTFCSSCWGNSPLKQSKSSRKCRFLEPSLWTPHTTTTQKNKITICKTSNKREMQYKQSMHLSYTESSTKFCCLVWCQPSTTLKEGVRLPPRVQRVRG